jgi:FkbM family methyltransferase
MIHKIISHMRQGDLIHVTKNYILNISSSKRINEWRSIKEKADSVVVDLGNKMSLKLYTDSVLSETIYVGRFENEEIDFVKRYLTSGDVFLDIGANVGLFTIVGASKVGPKGRVYSFEPVKKTFGRLTENINLNNLNNTKAYNLGLSNEDGELEMTTSADGFDAWNSFGKPSAGSSFILEKVPTFKLDSWIADEKIAHVSLVKIDVEGWEYNVILGAKSLLSSDAAPDLLVEFTEENCKNAGFSCAVLYDILMKYGYQMFLYDEIKKTIIPESKRKVYTHMNIVATKNPERVIKRIK